MVCGVCVCELVQCVQGVLCVTFELNALLDLSWQATTKSLGSL